MDAFLLQSEEIDNIFKNHLKIESKVMSIESIFSNIKLESKIIYDPYYQRNYVWDKSKATYFIESILLGTEIPPLVFFDNQEHIEIIDGRQRYETIKRFISGDIVLSKDGLKSLFYLKNNGFTDLIPDIKDIFWDTKIRILEFSIINEPRLDEKKEDLIKKEIFRRYNSGITPLKTPEIENAIYINDDLTGYFKRNIRNDRDFYKKILQLFATERDLERIDKKNTLDKVMLKIRQLLVLHNIPIKKYSTLSGRNEYLASFYEKLSDETLNVEKFYHDFKNKIDILIRLREILLEKDTDLGENRLVYECTFWMFTILEAEIETIKLNGIFSEELLLDYADFLIFHQDKFTLDQSHFYKKINERYNLVADYFAHELKLKFSIYLDDYSVFKQVKEEMSENELQNNTIDDFGKLESLRLNKPEPSSMTIEDICRQMNRDKFLIRPPYQREEVINKIKSSALIESIILGIKLPPIFIYKNTDGISEVIDGQQRILSILGFLGEEFTNEEGERVKSEKNNFKLDKLNILSELNGRTFVDLDQKAKDKILDFNLAVVNIDAKLNPQFDKIDLFIRLNSKPYPIKDNSFEMWNSYVDKDVISTIKQNVKNHSSWFYLKRAESNARMDNEELYTALAYLEYKKNIEKSKDLTSVPYLTIYQKENKMFLRIKEKPDITKVLNLVTTPEKEQEKNRFMGSVKNVESFIKKLKLILLDKDIPDEADKNEYLIKELNNLFNPIAESRKTTRITQSFYSLWIILCDTNLEMVKKYRKEMKEELSTIFLNIRNIQENTDGVLSFKIAIDSFNHKYKTENRRIKLSRDEINNLISKQNNICPICKCDLFIGDDIEIDHSVPLAIGGRDGFLNLQVVHKDCNRKKRAKLIEEE